MHDRLAAYENAGNIRPLSFSRADRTVPGVTGRGRHRLAASVLVVALGTACGGGGGENRTDVPRAVPHDVGVPRSVSTTSIFPYASASADSDGVPPPVVVERGTDGAAIARSLLEYGRWLARHDPDPALVENGVRAGSVLARNVARDGSRDAQRAAAGSSRSTARRSTSLRCRARRRHVVPGHGAPGAARRRRPGGPNAPAPAGRPRSAIVVIVMRLPPTRRGGCWQSSCKGRRSRCSCETCARGAAVLASDRVARGIVVGRPRARRRRADRGLG